MEEEFSFQACTSGEHAIPETEPSDDLKFVASGAHPAADLGGKPGRQAPAGGTTKHKTPVGYTVAGEPHVAEYDHPLGPDPEP